MSPPCISLSLQRPCKAQATSHREGAHEVTCKTYSSWWVAEPHCLLCPLPPRAPENTLPQGQLRAGRLGCSTPETPFLDSQTLSTPKHPSTDSPCLSRESQDRARRRYHAPLRLERKMQLWTLKKNLITAFHVVDTQEVLV